MLLKHIKMLAMLSVFTITIVFSFPSYGAVHFITKKDAIATGSTNKPCQLMGYTYTKNNCPEGSVLSNQCPSNPKYYKTCGCDTKNKFTTSNCKSPNILTGGGCNNTYYDKCECDGEYKFNESNCASPKVLGTSDSCTTKTYSGNTVINGKIGYKSCSCPATYSKTCSGNMVPTNKNEVCDNKYTSCKCDPSKFSIANCPNGEAQGTTFCTEENGTKKYQSCKADITPAEKCANEGYTVKACPNKYYTSTKCPYSIAT